MTPTIHKLSESECLELNPRYRRYKQPSDIKAWLRDIGVSNYTIQEGGTVDIHDCVNISYVFSHLKYIPIQFGVVEGFFNCSDVNLQSLVGSPHTVKGYFDVGGNELKSLLGGPASVDVFYRCENNQLTDLLGSPMYLGETFNAGSNSELSSIQGFDTLLQPDPEINFIVSFIPPELREVPYTPEFYNYVFNSIEFNAAQEKRLFTQKLKEPISSTSRILKI